MVEIQRREILTGGLATLATLATSRISEAFAQTSIPEHETSVSEKTLSDTFIKTTLTYVANTVTEIVFNTYAEHYGLPRLGNAKKEDVLRDLQEERFQTYFKSIVGAGVLEEALFRWAPGILINQVSGTPDLMGKGKPEKTLGVFMALLFAGSHNVQDDTVDTRHIPSSQFIGGLVMWHLMRTYGIGASMLGHAVYNTYWTIALELENKFRDKK